MIAAARAPSTLADDAARLFELCVFTAMAVARVPRYPSTLLEELERFADV